jgi:hypothetical protein
MTDRQQLLPEDFGPDALADIAYAGSAVIWVVEDVNHHHNAWPGWDCWGTNPAEEIGRVRDVIAQIEAGLKEAKQRLAEVERPARLAAARRTRQARRDVEPEAER